MQALASLDRVNEAILVGQTALETLEARDGGRLAGLATINLGSTLAMAGRSDEAIPYLDRARLNAGAGQP